MGEIVVPRNFKLLEELDQAEKASGDISCSLGLVHSDDIFLTDWNASIIGPPGSTHDQRFYELRLTAGPKYPTEAPQVRFLSRVNMSCVNQTTGEVTTELRELGQWNQNMTLENILVGIKNSMNSPANRRVPQPPDGTSF
jgi:ubiquitin-protein ligase